MEFISKVKVKEYTNKKVTLMETKMDGHYVEVYKDIDGHVEVYQKRRKVNIFPKLAKIDSIRESLEKIPNDTILRCELHALGIQATSIPTLLNEASHMLLLSPFRIERWDSYVGSEYTFDEKNVLFHAHFTHVPRQRFFTEPRVLTSMDIVYWNLEARRLGIEGWVAKDKPGGGMWKVKPVKTVDAVVMGTTVSDSDSFKGGLKAIQVGLWDKETGLWEEIASVGSGFETKYRMSVDLYSLNNRVAEISYQDLASKGKLKFPRFVRWRDDEKTIGECSMDQLK